MPGRGCGSRLAKKAQLIRHREILRRPYNLAAPGTAPAVQRWGVRLVSGTWVRPMPSDDIERKPHCS